MLAVTNIRVPNNSFKIIEILLYYMQWMHYADFTRLWLFHCLALYIRTVEYGEQYPCWRQVQTQLKHRNCYIY